MQAEDGEMDLVATWLKWDPTRLIAGALAGLFAGVMMLAFAMIIAVVMGHEAWFPIKVAALPFLGQSATEVGPEMRAILVGFVAQEFLCMILGMIYAQVTGTNSLPTLLVLGFVWGTFSWIFINNLFLQSFKAIYAAHLSAGAAFPVNIIFGLSLTSVAFFDRALRGNRV